MASTNFETLDVSPTFNKSLEGLLMKEVKAQLADALRADMMPLVEKHIADVVEKATSDLAVHVCVVAEAMSRGYVVDVAARLNGVPVMPKENAP